MSSTSVGQLTENVTEVVGEVLSTGKERASDAATRLPEVAESVSRLARASAETVADLATTAIALTPFVHRQSRGRRASWWLVPVLVLGALAAFAIWKRSRGSDTEADASSQRDSNVSSFDRSTSAATA